MTNDDKELLADLYYIGLYADTLRKVADRPATGADLGCAARLLQLAEDVLRKVTDRQGA
jgi:hypothetical protein